MESVSAGMADGIVPEFGEFVAWIERGQRLPECCPCCGGGAPEGIGDMVREPAVIRMIFNVEDCDIARILDEVEIEAVWFIFPSGDVSTRIGVGEDLSLAVVGELVGVCVAGFSDTLWETVLVEIGARGDIACVVLDFADDAPLGGCV